MESINKLKDAPTIRPTHQAILGLHSEQQANRKFMIGGLFLIMAFSAATFGLTLGAAEFSKESTVSSDGALLVKGTTQTVKTADVDQAFVPIIGNEDIEVLAEIHTVMIAETEHHVATKRLETVTKVQKEGNDKVVITTSDGAYTVPSEDVSKSVWYLSTQDKIPGTDKRLGKIIGEIGIGIGGGDFNLLDRCDGRDGTTTTECCTIDGVRNRWPTVNMGVCEYVCTETIFGWKHWIKTETETCTSGCCK